MPVPPDLSYPPPTDHRSESGVFYAEAQGGTVMKFDMYDHAGQWRGQLVVPVSDSDGFALETAQVYLATRERECKRSKARHIGIVA